MPYPEIKTTDVLKNERSNAVYRKASIDAPLEPSSQNHLRMVWVRTGQGLGCRWVGRPTAAHLAPPPSPLRSTGHTRLCRAAA
jgi:hypothetical protein